MTKKPVSNAPPPIKPVRGLSVPRRQSNGAQVHQVHKPDWSMWSGDQRVAIEEAVALTMDIDPTPLSRVQDFITPDALPKTRRKEFCKRQIALQGLFPGKSRIKLSEAMDRVVKMKWSGLPPELVAMAVLPVPKPPHGAEALPIASAGAARIAMPDVSASSSKMKQPNTLPENAPVRGRRMKRKALIEANFPRWETIERDLKDAAANGLSDRAKPGADHGYWWEGLALAWAEENGKLRSPSAASSSVRTHLMPR